MTTHASIHQEIPDALHDARASIQTLNLIKRYIIFLYPLLLPLTVVTCSTTFPKQLVRLTGQEKSIELVILLALRNGNTPATFNEIVSVPTPDGLYRKGSL